MEISKAEKTLLTDELSVQAIHKFYYYRLAKTFQFKGERHDFHELCYAVSGNILVKTDEGEFILKEKEYMVCKPNVFHAMLPYKDSASFYSLSFWATGVSTDITMNVRQITSQQLFILEMIAHTYTQNFPNNNYKTPKPMYSPMNDDYAFKQLIKNLLESLLILFTQQCLNNKVTPPHSESNKNNLVNLIKEYISEHYSEHIVLSDIAKALNYSTEHICRKFHEKTGYSIANYITKVRLNKAMEMLSKDSNVSVSDVAFSVGFTDAYYFSKIFSKYVGMSPKAYIKYTQETHLLNSLFVFSDIIT